MRETETTESVIAQLYLLKNIRHEHFNMDELAHWLVEDPRQEVVHVKFKMLQNVRCIPTAELLTKITAMHEAEIIEEPYAVLFDVQLGRSKYWAYKRTEAALQKKPSALIWSGNEYSQRNIAMMREREMRHFLIIDDAAYSGRQITSDASIAILQCAEAGMQNPVFIIRVPFMTTVAEQRIRELCDIHIVGTPQIIIPDSVERIPSIRELLTPQELEALQLIDPILGSDVYLNCTLTYFEQSFPDAWSFDPMIREQMKTKIDKPYRTDAHHLADEQAALAE